jgi:prevent-host-death family protein
MKTIGAGKFKEKCLALLDEVSEEHETIIVTKRGKPVAIVSPVTESETSLREKLRGSILQEGDIISPVDVQWNATK